MLKNACVLKREMSKECVKVHSGYAKSANKKKERLIHIDPLIKKKKKKKKKRKEREANKKHHPSLSPCPIHKLYSRGRAWNHEQIGSCPKITKKNIINSLNGKPFVIGCLTVPVLSHYPKKTQRSYPHTFLPFLLPTKDTRQLEINFLT